MVKDQAVTSYVDPPANDESTCECYESRPSICSLRRDESKVFALANDVMLAECGHAK